MPATLEFTPEQELAMDQVGTGECGLLSPKLADHVHRVAAHALLQRVRMLHVELEEARRQRDEARSELARYKQQVRTVTLNTLADEAHDA